MSVQIIFGGFALQNELYITQDIDVYSAPKKTISRSELARDDGAVSYARRLNSKSVVANGVISTNSTTALEQAIDALKRACNRTPTSLDIGYLDGYRRYTAEVENLIIKRGKGDVTMAAYSIEFYCDKPYATDPDTTTFMPQQNLTAQTSVIPIAVGGSYKAEPLIEMQVMAIAPTTTPVQLIITNPVTAQSVTIERIFAVNDTITIDIFNKSIYVNNDISPYKGQLPKFDPGDGTIEISDTATSRTIAINGQYNKRYL